MARARIHYLSDNEKAFIHEKVLEVLSEVGVAYNTPKAIDILEAAGAEVDRETLTAKLTWDIIEPALKTVPKQVLLAGRDPGADVVLGGERWLASSDGMTTAMLDDLTGERRDATTQDLADVTRLCDALDEIDFLWPSPQMSDVSAWNQPITMQATLVRNSVKHVQDEVRTPEEVDYILDIYEAAAGAPLTERPIFSCSNCTIAPLQHDKEMTEAGLKMVHRGVPLFILPMPLAGTTAPMSVLAACILDLAEMLSGVVLYQLEKPGCALISTIAAGVSDMRTGGYISAGPEIGLINMIGVEMSKFYGMPTQSTGMSADAKGADFQAGSEGGMTALSAALVGCDSLIAAGGLNGILISSLAKIVLDTDQIGALRRYMREDPIDEAHAMINDIKEIGIGGHFLNCKSTRKFARSEVWRPSYFHRGAFEEFKANPLIPDAVAKAKHILDTHEVTPLPDDVEKHIQKTLDAWAALEVK